VTSWGYATSTGLDFTHPDIVDLHFEACRDAYADLLARAGIGAGAHVLDAGCGSGSYLPLIAGLVGPAGRITAVDLAPENVEAVRSRLRLWSSPCPVSAEVAALSRLPYADDTFDVVWCANTTQYLDDAELAAALAELRRVVRPGGLVAVKDLDAGLITASPGDPYLFVDFFRLAAETSGYARQLMRSRELHHWLSDTGLTAVRQQSVLIEHFAPHPAPVHAFYASSCAQLARQAGEIGAPGAWSSFLDPADPANPLNGPRSYIREGNVLAVGTVPAGPPQPPRSC
jgi:ubiquinone/menaquinone biosynthesis C-methylase UbiE